MAGPEGDDGQDEAPTRVLPRTPVYPKDPAKSWEASEGERVRGPADKVSSVLKDRRFHRLGELLGQVSFQEMLLAMRDLVASGHAFDRCDDAFRLRFRASTEAPQSVQSLTEGLASKSVFAEPVALPDLPDDEDGGGFDPEDDVGTGGAKVAEQSAESVGLVLSDPPSSLTLPLHFLHSMTGAILAKRGSGKTYLGMVIVEELLRAPSPVSVVVWDPTGVWWGLCATDGGAPSSHEILLLGGARGHLPISSKDGAKVAELAHEPSPRAIVVDMSELAPSEQHEMVADFCERLLSLPRFQIHVVFDEADEFAPQKFGAVSGHQRRSLGFVERLVMRGRSRGIGATLITLRPAVLSKNVLSQVDALYLLRMVEPNDLRAVKTWLENFENGISPEQRGQCLGLLPVLPVGTSYFLRGGDEIMFRRFKVRRKLSFDSSRTPDSGIIVSATLRTPSPLTMAVARKILRAAG